MGLLGSDYFVNNPPFSLDRVTAMVNFDMVGRLNEGKMQVFGTESAEDERSIVSGWELDPQELDNL